VCHFSPQSINIGFTIFVLTPIYIMLYDYNCRMFLLQTYQTVCNTCGIDVNRGENDSLYW
jgi:hypothetical protein